MNHLRKIRAEKGLSQLALAGKAGVSQPCIHLIETGATRQPELTTLQSEVHKGRNELRRLLGDEIKLIPTEGRLEAEIRGDFAELLGLASPKLNLVAGAGFEPATFGL